MKRNKVKRILSTATAMALTTTTLAGGMTAAAPRVVQRYLHLKTLNSRIPCRQVPLWLRMTIMIMMI